MIVTGTLQAAMQTTTESSNQEFLKLAAMLPTYIPDVEIKDKS